MQKRSTIVDDLAKDLIARENESLTELAERIKARVEEVGLERAAEESWEDAKAGLGGLSERLARYRKEHGIPENEL